MSTAERTPMVDRQRPMAGRAPSESTLLPGGVPSLSTPPRGVAYRGAHTPSLAKQQAYAPSFDPHDEATATEQQLGKAARKSELQMINDQFLHLYGIQVEGHNKYKDEEHRRKNGENSDPTHGRRNHGTISPEDTFRLTWNIVQAVILVYVAVVVPFRIGFDINLEPFTGGWWFEAGVDLFFILDMGLNFFTGYFDEDDALEMRREKIAAQYLKSWFIIDLVSCLPIQYVLVFMDVEGPEAASHTKILKGLRLFRLAKLLRLGKLRDIFHQYEEEMASLAQAVKFCFYVIIILYSCHLIGCLWFLIGLESARPEDPNWPSNWITNRGIDDKPVEHQYLTSIYWAMTVLTTVGFGDIGPSTPAEMVFSCVAEMAGCFMFAILMGSIAAMITGEQMLKLKVDEQMNALTEYLRAKDINVELRSKLRCFLEDVYEATAFDEREMLESLPSELRQEVQEELYVKMTLQIPFMNRSVLQGDLSIVPKLSQMLTPRLEMEGAHIYKEDDIGQELYIIIEGEVTLHTGDALSLKVKASQMADKTDRYYRKLLGYDKDPDNQNDVFEAMSMPELRKRALDAGITSERFKRTETPEEISAELQSMDIRQLREAALDRGVAEELIFQACEPVGARLIDLIITAELNQPGRTMTTMAEREYSRKLRQMNFEDLQNFARNHEHIDLQELMDAVGHANATSTGTSLAGKQALIDLILLHSGGDKMKKALMNNMIEPVDDGAPDSIIEAPLTAKQREKERAAIILELTSRAGTIFGERELFFSRRSLPEVAQTTYTVEGKKYVRLPIEGRLRHQTATVTSHLKASLMYMNWKSVTELHKNEGYAGRKVFDWIRRVAELREDEDKHTSNIKAMKSKVALLSKKDEAAKVMQTAWRKKRIDNIQRMKKQEWEESALGKTLSAIQTKQLNHDEMTVHLSNEVYGYRQVEIGHLKAKGVSLELLQEHEERQQSMSWYSEMLEQVEQDCYETWKSLKNDYEAQLYALDNPNRSAEEEKLADERRKHLRGLLQDRWDEVSRALVAIEALPRRKQLRNKLARELKKRALISAAHEAEMQRRQAAWEKEPPGKATMAIVQHAQSIDQKLDERMGAVEATLAAINEKLTSPLSGGASAAELPEPEEEQSAAVPLLPPDAEEPEPEPEEVPAAAAAAAAAGTAAVLELQERIGSFEASIESRVGGVQEAVTAVEKRMGGVEDTLQQMNQMLFKVFDIAKKLEEDLDEELHHHHDSDDEGGDGAAAAGTGSKKDLEAYRNLLDTSAGAAAAQQGGGGGSAVREGWTAGTNQ